MSTTASSCCMGMKDKAFVVTQSRVCTVYASKCAVMRLAVISLLKGEAKPFVSPDNNTVCVCVCV